eukprot:4665089-Pyramimonas_sp.AAC.1
MERGSKQLRGGIQELAKSLFAQAASRRTLLILHVSRRGAWSTKLATQAAARRTRPLRQARRPGPLVLT